MQLRHLKIENYRAIKRREFSFEDPFGRIRPITVLAGPNGCGKTTALFGIIQALRGVMGYRTADVPQPSDLDIHHTGAGAGATWASAQPCVRIELDLRFDQIELDAIPQALENTAAQDSDVAQALPELRDGLLRAIWQYPPEHDREGRKRPTWFLSKTEPRGAVPWFKGHVRAIQGWRNRQPGSRKLLDDIGGIYLFPQDRNLQSRVVGNLGQPGDVDPAGSADGTQGLQRFTRREQSVWDVLEYLSSYARAARTEPLPDEENWEKRIIDAFHSICAPKEYAGFLYQRDDPNGAPCIKDGATIYPLQQAASGEQVIIEYLARLNYPSPMNHSLILIDEPEIHLHPGWIRQLYRALPKIGVNNQFILTTHSLELRAMAAEDGALIDMGKMESVR